MNLNQLRYFLSVCRFGNITKASENMNISQPSVTIAIKEMENELGFQLFYRIHNRISLTPEGELFLKITEDFMSNHDNFYSTALDLGIKKSRNLKIGIPSILGTFFLGKIVPAFNETYPDIHLEIHEVPTLIGVKMLEESDLDLFVGIMDDTKLSGCNSKFIFSTDLVLVVSKKSSLVGKCKISSEQLMDQPLVIVPKGSYHYKVITENFPDLSANIILHSNQLSTIKYMVENNFAATIIYKEIFQNNPNVCTIELENPIEINIGVFWQKNAYISYAKNAFVDFICKVVSS